MTYPKISELKNIVPNWNTADYFADAALNFHSLWDFQRDKKLYAAGFYAVKETTDAMRQGTQFHQIALEGEDVFHQHNAIWIPPVNEKTGKPYGADTKAYAAAREEWEKENPGKTGYTEEEYQTYSAMLDALGNHPYAGGYLFPADEGAEYASELKFKGEYAPGWFAKGSIDRYDPEIGILDLKTCAEIERFDGYETFSKTCIYGGYIEQLAFYQIMFSELIDPRGNQGEYIPVTIIGIEKKEPYRVAVCQPDEETQEAARERIRALLVEYAEAVTTQNFPSKYDEIITLHKYYKES